MSGADPFFRLPTELCCAILRNWLFLKSIVRLDSAVCSAEKRLLLWNTIFASVQCVLPQTRHTYRGRCLFDWLCKRRLHTTGCCLSWDVDNSVREYLCDCGDTIRTVEFAFCDASIYLPLISQHCSNVVCLVFYECHAGLFLEHDVECLNSRLEALDVSMAQLAHEGIEKVVQQCPNIAHIALPICTSFSDNCGNYIGCNLKHLKFLCVSFTYITDEMLIDIAEHCSSTLEGLYVDDCEKLRGEGLNAILRSCTKLRLAQIDNFASIFDDFVPLEFSMLCNLTELHIISRGATSAFMDSVAANCTRLQCLVLSWRYASKSSTFKLEIFTVQRLPELKVLLQGGFPESELDKFTLMRPEVQVDELKTENMTPNFFDMKF